MTRFVLSPTRKKDSSEVFIVIVVVSAAAAALCLAWLLSKSASAGN